MTALRQLQVLILAATLGTIAGSLVLLSRDDLRPVAVAAAVGVVLLVLTFAARTLPPPRAPSVARVHSLRFGQVLVTFAGVAAIVFALNLLVGSEVRGTSAPAGSQTPSVRPSSTATSQTAGPVAPIISSPPAGTTAASSVVPSATPAATAAPESAAPATSASASPATSAPTTPSPAVTAPPTPAQTASQSPQSPSAMPTPTPTSFLPTLPPVPTLPPLPTATIRLP